MVTQDPSPGSPGSSSSSNAPIAGALFGQPGTYALGTTSIYYVVGKQVIVTASVAVSYTYGANCFEEVTDPYDGFKAHSTQAITNNLPPWMRLRDTEDADGWKLINSWGINLEKAAESINSRLKNLFLATSDRWQRHKLYKGSVVEPELFEDIPSRNFLHNSSFSIPDVARLRLPAGWTDYFNPTTQRVFLDSNNQMVGTYCLRADGPCTIGQITGFGDSGPVQDVSASVYVKSGTAFKAILSVIIEDIHTVSVAAEKELSSSSGKWERIKLTFRMNREPFQAQFTIKIVSGSKVYIDAPQLEIGPRVTEWQASDVDKLPYPASTQPFRLAEAVTNNDRVTLYPFGDTDEFITTQIPTRLEKKPPPPIDIEPFSTSAFGENINIFDTRVATAWSVNSNQISEQDANNEYEVFNRYDIRDLAFFQGLGYGTINDCDVSMVPLATAVRDDLLFVVTREIHRGRTIRVLKVVIPRRPPGSNTYLESIVDFEIPLDFNTTYGADNATEEISSIGFSERNPSWMVLNTDFGRRFYYRLYYDYYYVRNDTRALYTIEEYKGATIRLT